MGGKKKRERERDMERQGQRRDMIDRQAEIHRDRIANKETWSWRQRETEKDWVTDAIGSQDKDGSE